MGNDYKIVECKFTEDGIFVTEKPVKDYGIFDIEYSKTGSLKFRVNHKGFPKIRYYPTEKINTYDISYRLDDKLTMFFEKNFQVDEDLVIMAYALEKRESLESSLIRLKGFVDGNIKITGFINQFLTKNEK